MSEGLIEGLTGAWGDELSSLGGLRSTRLQAQFTASATVIDYGADMLAVAVGVPPGTPATYLGSVAADATGVTLTLTRGQERGFSPNIVGGHRVRGLSPLIADSSVSDEVVTRDSAVQLTLLGGVFDASFNHSAWEVYDPGLLAVLQVETTFGWPAAGEFVMADGLYRYASLDATHLYDIEYFNGEVWTYQLPQDLVFEIGDEIVDLSRTFSAVDAMWRSFTIEYAVGDDLDVVGSNLGVRRPPTANDALYRKVIKALAYVPRGTMWVIELLLDAVLGAGNYEVFEDLTQRAPATELGVGDPHFRFSANHPAQVFISTGPTDSPFGKTFVEATERRPLLAPRVDAVTLSWAINKVIGVELASENFEALVSGGSVTSAAVTATSNGTATELTVTLPSGSSFPSGQPLRGDDFYITSAGMRGRIGPIAARVSDTQLLISDFEGAVGMNVRRGWTGLAWKITREKTSMRHGHRPSADFRIEYDGGPLRRMWTYDGADLGDPLFAPTAEVTYMVPTSEVGSGNFIRIVEPPSNDSMAYYKQNARVVAKSFADFEVLLRVVGASFGFENYKGQFSMRLEDGSRLMAVGVLGTIDGATRVGFYNPDLAASSPWLTTGALYLGGAHTIPAGDWATITIRKFQDRNVQLLVDGRVVEDQPYLQFPPGTGLHQRVFGNLIGSQTGVQADVKHADWSAYTPHDYFNYHVTSGSVSAAGVFTDPGPVPGAFDQASVGALVRVTRAATLGVLGGDARGEWEVDTLLTTHSAQAAQGRLRIGSATVINGSPLRILIEDGPGAFSFPQDLGNQILLESGPDVSSTWQIDQLLTPTGDDLDSAGTAPRLPATSNLAVVSPVAPTVGVLTTQSRSDWRLLLAALPGGGDPDVDFEVIDQGLVLGLNLTLPQNFPIALYPTGDGPLVEAHYSRILSAQVLPHDGLANAENPTAPDYLYYPFYLADDFGWVRGLLDVVTAAGVHVDLRSFFLDAAGPHIR